MHQASAIITAIIPVVIISIGTFTLVACVVAPIIIAPLPVRFESGVEL